MDEYPVNREYPAYYAGKCTQRTWCVVRLLAPDRCQVVSLVKQAGERVATFRLLTDSNAVRRFLQENPMLPATEEDFLLLEAEASFVWAAAFPPEPVSDELPF